MNAGQSPEELDPRLRPTPDYGSLGPGSDVRPDQPVRKRTSGNIATLRISAALVGVLAAFISSSAGTVHSAWEQISEFLKIKGKPVAASPAILSQHEIQSLDEMKPQAQVELLLERAINHYDGAGDQIAARVDGWHGKIKMTQSLNSLFTVALNANDLRVRAAAIEVDLAALNVDKNSASIDRLEAQALSGDQPQRVWAVWTMGLLGNRGVQPGRVSETLQLYTRDPNENVRYWAVEALAYLGTDDVIAPLLQIFHDDPSPTIRERAACGLAQSGMLNEEQRRRAVPRLLEYAEDSSLDPQTRGWVYQALRDITGKTLPNDPASWRNAVSSSGS